VTVRGPADLILLGGPVWAGMSRTQGPLPDALAVLDGRVLAVGSQADILALKGPSTRIHPLDGATLLPGFVDAHVHFLSGGLDLARVDLRGARSLQEVQAKVGSAAASQAAGSWILGGGWDEHRWGGALPHRAWLDQVAPQNPVFLTRTDLHVGVANTQGLLAAGIPLRDGDGPGPEAGLVDLDTDGLATGILREGAMDWVHRALPPVTEEAREAALLAAAQEALSHGITQVHDKGVLQQPEASWASLGTLMRLRDAGILPVRVSAAVPLSERHALHARIQEMGRGCERLQWGAVKSFVDGSLGAGTAWFLDDYAHLPGHRGGPVEALDTLAQALEEAVLLGLDPIVHAIGDAATTWLADQYRRLLEVHGAEVRQLRLEHAQHLTPALVACLTHPRIVLSMQPAHLLDDGPWMGRFVGEARLPFAYAFRTLVSAGARVALGSDWTVAPMDPRVALQGAVRGPHPGGPETLTVEEALHAHTAVASEAAGFRGKTGILAPGRRADFTLWATSPLTLSPEQDFREIQVESTWVDGVQMWSRDRS